MFHKFLRIFPFLVFSGFINFSGWVIFLPFGVLLLSFFFSQKAVWFSIPGYLAILVLSTLTGQFSISMFIGIVLLAIFEITILFSEDKKKTVFYFSLTWLLALTYFGGPIAIISVGIFMGILVLLLKKFWVIFFIPILFLPILPINFSSQSFSQTPQIEKNDESLTETEKVFTIFMKEITPLSAPLADAEEQSEWIWNMGEVFQQVLIWSFISLGCFFIFAVVKLFKEFSRPRKENQKKFFKRVIFTGSLLAVLFLLTQIQPANNVSGTSFTQIPPYNLSESLEYEINIVHEEGDEIEKNWHSAGFDLFLMIFEFGIFFTGIVTASFLLIRYLRSKTILPEKSAVLEEDINLNKEQEEFSFTQTGNALVKTVYKTFRDKKFPLLKNLTPSELLKKFPSASLKELTEEYIKVEYAFSETLKQDDEIRRLFFKLL